MCFRLYLASSAEQRGFKTYTSEKLKNKIYEYVVDGPMICTDEIIYWANTCHPNISIHAYDSIYSKFVTHISPNPVIVLVYVIKDHHLYPITDQRLKVIATKANAGGCDDLLKHMCELKWTKRHENIVKLEDVEDIHNLEVEDKIIILPEE